jgi:PAS domain S-box-containing protein
MSDQPLRPNQPMLEAILDSAVGAIVTIDDRGIIQTANPATQKLFGFSEQELIGQNVSLLMPEPHKSKHDEYIANHLSTGECKIIGIGRDVEALRKNGSLCPVHLSVSAFEVNRDKYFAGILHDLSASERLKAEADRQASLFQAVFENVPEALIITDLSSRILLINPAACRLFGYSRDELVGQSAKLLYANTVDFSRASAVWQELDGIESRSQRQIEAELQHAQGHSFPGQIVCASVYNARGEKVGIIALVRDLSLQQKEEEARLKSQRLEAIGQLTGGIAHDFNNLLTIISGNLELLEGYLQSERGQDHLRRAQVAADAGARLTDRLLTFARRRKLEPKVIPLNEQVLAMTELLRRTLGTNIELITHRDPSLWTTQVDSGEIENALLNLAINARDAMPNGGKLIIETSNVTLDADNSRQEPGITQGDYVRVSVSDTGSGMTRDVIRHAFEPFFTTKEHGRGTGLGLSTIYGFVKQSGGNVTIYSEPGSGTTVNIYLPRYKSADTGTAEGGKTEVIKGFSGETILVVEDNPEVRAVVVERLKRMGLNVLHAEAAAEAIDLLQKSENIDAVFTDIVMPGGMSGFDLANWVLNNRKSAAVLLTSGFSEDVMHSKATDNLPILRKPYSQAELTKALRAVLDQRAR